MSGMKEVKATAHVHAAPAPRASLQKCVKGGSRAGSDEQAHCQGARVGAHAGDKTSTLVLNPDLFGAQVLNPDLAVGA